MAANVNVILSRDVPNLGRVGDLVSVRPGYARNYLLPQRLAMPVSKKNLAHFEHQKKVIAHRLSELRSASEGKAKDLSDVQIDITAKVGEQDKLFGSIGSRDIAAALAERGFVVDHRDIKMEGPLKTVGLHELEVRLEADVVGSFKVVIVPEAVEEELSYDDDDYDDDDYEGEEAEGAEESTEASETSEDAEAAADA